MGKRYYGEVMNGEYVARTKVALKYKDDRGTQKVKIGCEMVIIHWKCMVI